jgi:hypothetical protein
LDSSLKEGAFTSSSFSANAIAICRSGHGP